MLPSSKKKLLLRGRRASEINWAVYISGKHLFGLNCTCSLNAGNIFLICICNKSGQTLCFILFLCVIELYCCTIVLPHYPKHTRNLVYLDSIFQPSCFTDFSLEHQMLIYPPQQHDTWTKVFQPMAFIRAVSVVLDVWILLLCTVPQWLKA